MNEKQTFEEMYLIDNYFSNISNILNTKQLTINVKKKKNQDL